MKTRGQPAECEEFYSYTGWQRIEIFLPGLFYEKEKGIRNNDKELQERHARNEGLCQQERLEAGCRRRQQMVFIRRCFQALCPRRYLCGGNSRVLEHRMILFG